MESREHSPTQVSAQLGVKLGMVRRYLMAYEQAMGEPLPRDPKTNARLASDEALSVLERARGVVRENPAVSVEDAVRAVLGLHTAPTAPTVPNAVITSDVLELLKALTDTVREQTGTIKTLQDEVAALPSGEDKIDIAEAVNEGLAPLLARLEAQETELRALRAVMAAKQDTPKESTRRPWWQVWRKN